MPANEEPSNDRRILFCIVALMFFVLPIRVADPETRTQKEFRLFINRFNRTYNGSAEEYQRRYNIFKDSIEMIENMRQDKHRVFGVTRFSDWSMDEFRQRYLSERPLSRPRRKVAMALQRFAEKNFGRGPAAIPHSVDWRRTGVITPIRNQGVCGSCYAHSVIANVEAMHAVRWNSTAAREFSVQQMIDCAGNHNHGCTGGDTCNLLQWLKSANVSILPTESFPLSGRRRACKKTTTSRHLPPGIRTARVTDFTCFSFVEDETEMLAHLAFKGPLIAAVNASPWKHYVGGVIRRHCNGPPNHAVQIVGYDLTGRDEPHYIVRNSWGTGFGHQGYVKLAIGANVCGIAEEVSSVTVD